MSKYFGIATIGEFNYRKSSNTPEGVGGGGLLNFEPSGRDLIRGGGGGLLERRAHLRFFDRQRQNCTISMEFEMLRSFNNNYELLR